MKIFLENVFLPKSRSLRSPLSLLLLRDSGERMLQSSNSGASSSDCHLFNDSLMRRVADSLLSFCLL